MISELLPHMRCPVCMQGDLQDQNETLACVRCGKAYPFRDGVLDMLDADASEVITPFQRIMQSPAVVSIYERLWRRAGYFIASSRSFDAEIETILRLRGRVHAERVLDLACGPGVFTRPLARRGGIVVGLDLSWPMLREARRRADREGLKNVLLIRGTAFRLPFRSGAFPLVNCCGALHLFDRPDAALEEIRRVVPSDGHLCVQTTIRPERSAGMAFVLERFIRFGFFREDRLRDQILRLGFQIVESERHRISFTFLSRHISAPMGEGQVL